MLLLLYILCFGRHRTPALLMSLLLILEIVAINTVIALNGAATNPFSSILLVPLSLGLILLPVTMGVAIVLLSIAAQCVQLYFLHAKDHHGEMMVTHAQGMIASFVATALLLTLVILYFQAKLNLKTRAIHQLRERQLRDEQLLAIGTAAAQLTHDAATPVQTLRLVMEEIQESSPPSLVQELEAPLAHLEELLSGWRGVADEVREAKLRPYTADAIVAGAKRLLRLSRPEAKITWSFDGNANISAVRADRTLVPALASIVINACDAASGKAITVTVKTAPSTWLITISNPYSQPLVFPQDTLGSRIIDSKTGFGVGAILSNATVEKFAGKVSWANTEQGVVTTVLLPAEPL